MKPFPDQLRQEGQLGEASLVMGARSLVAGPFKQGSRGLTCNYLVAYCRRR